ncbi:hypothetical protein BCR42DRAFT_166202 [Absidia repens]|uniref:C2H2-type domain-containing protein n=1 Tax=Absidia repens TaxID=90262 RepID=A0A1X2IU56_9FUNG|nr:hypothetical protein BCR42DRAFT_166202 [Absidia repens]
MTQNDDFTRVYSCSQCPKLFATRSNLKRHMENPNIHNIPYIRSRDQKRWKGHAKKIVSKEETTERMRKWRAENREKNRQNDLRCRVYRCAKQKFGDQDTIEKQNFIREEIIRRLGRKINTKAKLPLSSSASSASSAPSPSPSPSSPYSSTSAFSSASPPPSHHRITHRHRYQYQPTFIHDHVIEDDDEIEDEIEEDDDDNEENRSWRSDLPFYNSPHQKIQLPSIDSMCPSLVSSTSLRRRTSSSSESSISTSDESLPSTSPSSELTLPPVHNFLYPYQEQQESQQQQHQHQPLLKNINNNSKILDEFVGVVLEYAQDVDYRHSTHT